MKRRAESGRPRRIEWAVTAAGWLLLVLAFAAGCSFDGAGPGRLGGGDGASPDVAPRDSFTYADGGFIVRDLASPDGGSIDAPPPQQDSGPAPDGGPDLRVDQGAPADGPSACPHCVLGCDGFGVCRSFDVSNMPATTLELGTTVVEVPADLEVTVDTDALTFSTSDGQLIAVPQGAALLDLGDVVVFAVGGMLFQQNSTFRAVGSKPFAVAASGEIVVTGRIDVSGAGSRPGAGGGAGGAVGTAGSIGYGATNCAGGSAGSASGYDDASGGGGGGFGANGGDGGGGTAGGLGCGPPLLRPLVGGTGGGGGARSGGAGGGGGGAIQLSSGTRIVVDGAIKAGGGAGRGGDSGGAGGGAGSGGGILLEAPRVLINGSLYAEGGGGGGGGNGIFGGESGEGARNDGQRADGGHGGGTVFPGGGGGRGSGEGTSTGDGGGFSSSRGGGGGGGAGRIVLRSLTGVASGSGAVSPSALQQAIVVQ